jgi:hypothetical protein
MRHVTAAVLLALPLAVAALADDKKADPPPKGTLPKEWRRLGLTDQQKADAYALEAKYKPRIAELEAQVAALKDEEHKALLALLTDEQRKRLDQLLTGEEKPDAAPKDKDK